MPDGRIVHANREFVERFRYPNRDSLLQTPAEALYVDPADRVRWRARLEGEDVLRGFETQMRRADGTTFWARETARAVRNDAGDVVCYEGLLEDISEFMLAEQTQARLNRALEQAAESIVITDPQGTILYVNQAFERISGWSREQALGQNPRILRSGLQDAGFYRHMWETLARGEVWTGRFANRRKDGSLFEEEATISPIRDSSGRIVNYLAVKRDVANEPHQERKLLQAQKIEAVGRLAGGVAHDFNNLLAVIMGYGEIVLRQMEAADPLRQKMEQILRAAELAADLTRQLLAFSRKQVLQPRVLDLNVVVSSTEQMLHRIIGEDVELKTLLGPQLGSVRADPGQIEQIIMNLAVNARDAMPDGGRLTIETANAELDERYAASHAPIKSGSYVMLAVGDTGSGIDAATQSRIFEPFFTTKALGKGTGLGLSTVYGIVKQSEGYIWVYSEVGVGTAFKIYLPRVDEVAAPLAEPVRPPLLQGNETLLLVEDETALRELLRETLAGEGYDVLAADGAAEALQAAHAHAGPIHLMLTDVVMPGMTGPKVAESIAASRPEMKVLYLSGYSDESVVQHGLIGPGSAFLSKPFGPEVLLRKVRELLDGS